MDIDVPAGIDRWDNVIDLYIISSVLGIAHAGLDESILVTYKAWLKEHTHIYNIIIIIMIIMYVYILSFDVPSPQLYKRDKYAYEIFIHVPAISCIRGGFTSTLTLLYTQPLLSLYSAYTQPKLKHTAILSW